MEVGLIVAADRSEGIAKDGQIPWRLPSDMRHYRRMTTGTGHSTVLMGRATWESLPERFRPLPGRQNLVLSRTAQAFPGAEQVATFEASLAAAAGSEALWVIGGAQVYAMALAHPTVTVIELTRVDADFGCDLRWAGVPAGFAQVRATPFSDGALSGTFERWER